MMRHRIRPTLGLCVVITTLAACTTGSATVPTMRYRQTAAPVCSGDACPDPQRDEAYDAACPGTRQAVVLGGGGVRGAYQVGALWYLVNVLQCRFVHYVGSSTGAVSAAFLSQAQPRDLPRKVDELVELYLESTHRSTIVRSNSEGFIGFLRLLLPRWLGGTDGLHTLEPLYVRLKDRLDDATLLAANNLTVAVVSLQSGRLDPVGQHRPLSWVEYILGSASIPLVIEPRMARVIVRGRATLHDNDEVVFDDASVVGLIDPDCRLWLEAARMLYESPAAPNALEYENWWLKCKQAEPSTLKGGRWQTRLKLVDLSERDRNRLARLRRRAEPRFPAEFTTLHQLVDGGVTDHVPMYHAVTSVVPSRHIDSLFILSTDDEARAWGPLPRQGAFEIGETVLQHAWSNYLDQSMILHLQDAAFRGDLRDLVRWTYQLLLWVNAAVPADQQLGLPEFPMPLRVAMDQHMMRPNPDIFVIAPEARGEAGPLFASALDATRAAIVEAMHHGCVMAGKVALLHASVAANNWKFYRSRAYPPPHTTAWCDQWRTDVLLKE